MKGASSVEDGGEGGEEGVGWSLFTVEELSTSLILCREALQIHPHDGNAQLQHIQQNLEDASIKAGVLDASLLTRLRETFLSRLKGLPPGSFHQASICLKELLCLALLKRDSQGAVRVLGLLCDLCTTQGDLQQAVLYASQQLGAVKALGDGQRTALLSLQVGRAYGRVGDVLRSVGFLLQALQSAVDLEDRVLEIQARSILGNMYASPCLGHKRRRLQHALAQLEVTRVLLEDAEEKEQAAMREMVASWTRRPTLEGDQNGLQGEWTLAKALVEQEQEHQSMGIQQSSPARITSGDRGSTTEEGNKESEEEPHLRPTVNRELLAAGLERVGAAYLDLGELQPARRYFREQIQALEESGDLVALCNAHTNLGDADLATQTEINEALANYNRALERSIQRGDCSSEAAIRYRLAKAYSEVFDFERALECYQRSLELAMQRSDVEAVVEASALISRCYFDLDRFEEGEEAALLGVEAADRAVSHFQTHHWSDGALRSPHGCFAMAATCRVAQRDPLGALAYADAGNGRLLGHHLCKALEMEELLVEWQHSPRDTRKYLESIRRVSHSTGAHLVTYSHDKVSNVLHIWVIPPELPPIVGTKHRGGTDVPIRDPMDGIKHQSVRLRGPLGTSNWDLQSLVRSFRQDCFNFSHNGNPPPESQGMRGGQSNPNTTASASMTEEGFPEVPSWRLGTADEPSSPTATMASTLPSFSSSTLDESRRPPTSAPSVSRTEELHNQKPSAFEEWIGMHWGEVQEGTMGGNVPVSPNTNPRVWREHLEKMYKCLIAPIEQHLPATKHRPQRDLPRGDSYLRRSPNSGMPESAQSSSRLSDGTYGSDSFSSSSSGEAEEAQEFDLDADLWEDEEDEDEEAEQPPLVCFIPCGELWYVPWGALLDPSNNRHLIEDYLVSLAPSAGLLDILNQRHIQQVEQAIMCRTNLRYAQHIDTTGGDAVGDCSEVEDALGVAAAMDQTAPYLRLLLVVNEEMREEAAQKAPKPKAPTQQGPLIPALSTVEQANEAIERFYSTSVSSDRPVKRATVPFSHVPLVVGAGGVRAGSSCSSIVEEEAKSIGRSLGTQPLIGMGATRASVLPRLATAPLVHLGLWITASEGCAFDAFGSAGNLEVGVSYGLSGWAGSSSPEFQRELARRRNRGEPHGSAAFPIDDMVNSLDFLSGTERPTGGRRAGQGGHHITNASLITCSHCNTSRSYRTQSEWGAPAAPGLGSPVITCESGGAVQPHIFHSGALGLSETGSMRSRTPSPVSRMRSQLSSLPSQIPPHVTASRGAERFPSRGSRRSGGRKRSIVEEEGFPEPEEGVASVVRDVVSIGTPTVMLTLWSFMGSFDELFLRPFYDCLKDPPSFLEPNAGSRAGSPLSPPRSPGSQTRPSSPSGAQAYPRKPDALRRATLRVLEGRHRDTGHSAPWEWANWTCVGCPF